MYGATFICLLGILVVGQAAKCYPTESEAAVAGVEDGLSLHDTTLEALVYGDGYRVTCAVQVENWTRFNLTMPGIHMNYGSISVKPRTIYPGNREVTVLRKNNAAPAGTSGTVSWVVEGLQRRVYLMWSAPFFSIASNWMGVGLSVPPFMSHPGDDDLFDQMYKGDDSNVIKFERKEFSSNLSPVKFSDSDLQVWGTMTDSHEAIIKVTVRPQSQEDLADNIRAHLCDENGNPLGGMVG